MAPGRCLSSDWHGGAPNPACAPAPVCSRLVAYRLAILAHLARPPVHVLLAVEHDCLVAAEAASAWNDRIAARLELLFHRRIEAAFHFHGADPLGCLTGRLGIAVVPPARRITRFLHVHSEIDDVG